MAGKRSLPPIKLYQVNLVLYTVILILMAVYHPQLGWAVRSFPAFVWSEIKVPPEVDLYWKGSICLYRKEDAPDALLMLERSVSIDPNSEARLILGDYYYRSGHLDNALLEYEYFKGIDRGIVSPYLQASRIYLLRNEPEKARALIEEGIACFGDYQRYKPVREENVPEKFNEKAMAAYENRKKALSSLQAELRRLEGKKQP
jgi:tetratricopeptide (TPR) repeat protein